MSTEHFGATHEHQELAARVRELEEKVQVRCSCDRGPGRATGLAGSALSTPHDVRAQRSPREPAPAATRRRAPKHAIARTRPHSDSPCLPAGAGGAAKGRCIADEQKHPRAPRRPADGAGPRAASPLLARAREHPDVLPAGVRPCVCARPSLSAAREAMIAVAMVRGLLSLARTRAAPAGRLPLRCSAAW